MNSNRKGNIAEAEIAAAALHEGVDVLKPIGEHVRYDLVFDLAGQLLRVQCKWAAFKRRAGVITVTTASSRRGRHGHIRAPYTAEEIDLIAIYCGALRRCYLIPVALVDGRWALTLRTSRPENNQRAAIHYAADHEFSGAVAQLEERRRGTAEVTGSSPVSSIIPAHQGFETVGAHEFRERFGWYMQRAAAGERIRVTRRGKPSVQLISAESEPGC